MKYFFCTAIFLLALIALPAIAHYPTVTIDFIGGEPVTPAGPVLNIPYFPFTIDFEGAITHEVHGNLNVVEYWGEVNGEFIYGPEPLKGSGSETSTNYSIPWTVEAPGAYSITITAHHKNDDAAHGGRNNCKVAPAIAANYRKTEDLLNDPNSRGVQRAVAKETGKGGALFAKEKCEDWYETKTIEVIVGAIES